MQRDGEAAAATLMLVRALDFAARQHINQRRKGERAEPYVNHLTEVAVLLAETTNGSDVALVAAGLLHDTIEDTATTRDDLAAQFGETVASVVMEVTDDKSLPKAARKQLQIDHAPTLTARAKQVKLADKISNLRALVHTPPQGWSLERRREYFAWAARVVDGCRGINPHLERLFDDAHKHGMAHLPSDTGTGQTPDVPDKPA